MMDGNEQVAVQIVSARRTLEQTGPPGPARDQSDRFVEPDLAQRLRDGVGELKVEFVFWNATGAVRAGRRGGVAHINEHAKCRSRATAAVAGVLRYGVLSTHRLPAYAGKDYGECDNSDKRNLVNNHGSQLSPCGGFAAQLTLPGKSPRTLYLFPRRRTNKLDSVALRSGQQAEALIAM